MTILGRLLTDVFDIVFPRYCPMCGRRMLHDEEAVCITCLLHLPRTDYYTGHNEENIITKLLSGQLDIVRGTAYLYYLADSEVGRIVHAFKYYGQEDVAYMIGRVMATDLMEKDFFEGIDILIPIPLSQKRRRWRGYNQCEALCSGISEVTGIPIVRNAVKRKTFRKSQTKLGRIMRMQNVEQDFILRNAAHKHLNGKHVLLVDDVITTGATIKACGRALEGIEDIKISILALCHATNRVKTSS